MIWAWIKSLFNPEPQKDPHLQLYEDPDYSTMSKGDLKKLLAQGKIKSIIWHYFFPPFLKICVPFIP